MHCDLKIILPDISMEYSVCAPVETVGFVVVVTFYPTANLSIKSPGHLALYCVLYLAVQRCSVIMMINPFLPRGAQEMIFFPIKTYYSF